MQDIAGFLFSKWLDMYTLINYSRRVQEEFWVIERISKKLLITISRVRQIEVSRMTQ